MAFPKQEPRLEPRTTACLSGFLPIGLGVNLKQRFKTVKSAAVRPRLPNMTFPANRVCAITMPIRHNIQLGSLLINVLMTLVMNNAMAATYHFTDTTTTAGISGFVQATGMGSGAAAADFDGDGDVDIFLPTAQGTANLLFRNHGNGAFEEVAASLGLADTRQARVALWLDYDGDGDLDLALGRDCFSASGQCTDLVLSLYEQRPSGFVDVSTAVGLSQAVGAVSTKMHTGGLSAADISGDGLPDIYFARWQARPELYISDGLALRGDQAGYIHAGNLSGVGTQQAGHWQSLFHDFDGDDWPDLFVNIDFTANQLWLNNQNFTFTDNAAAAGVDSAWNEMGMAAADYDNDGDIDLYSTNIHNWIDPDQGRHNRLYRNDGAAGAPTFTDVAESQGVADTDWGWGAAWLDADNDGDLDLAVTNGYCQPDYCGNEHLYDRSRMFDHQGVGSGFAEVGVETGFDDNLIGGSLIDADFNGDGRLDLLQTAIDDSGTGHVRLLINQASAGAAPHHYLVIKPRLNGPNSHALAAVVRVHLANGVTLTRLITAGTSWMGQRPASAHFGIGAATRVERIEIEWPGTSNRSAWGAHAADATYELCCSDSLLSESFE